MKKPMTPQQYFEVLQFVQKYHRFGFISEERLSPDDMGMHIKYVDNVYDTRDKGIWCISFRGMGQHVRFATNSLVGCEPSVLEKAPHDNLFDWVMAYLKREWKICKLTEQYVVVKDK